VAEDSNTLVSVEDAQGRILSGVGVTEASLQETVEAREPVDPSAEAPSPATPESPLPVRGRDESSGQFKKGRADKRIGQLTAQKSEEIQKREVAEARALALEHRLAALEAHRSQLQTPQAQATQEPATPAPTRTKPSEDEVGVKYQTYADFAEDLADWKVEQRLQAFDFDARIRTSIEADRASRAQQEYVQSFATRARSVYPDFDAVLAQADASIQFPDLRVLINAPNAEHLVYHLAKDKELARKIATERDPIRLGYLMASVQGPPQGSASPAPPPPPVASSAPAPYQPVGSSTRTSAPTLDDLASKGFDYDASGYREKRRSDRTRR